MNLSSYIDNINQRYRLGNATEHTFRGDLQQLIEYIIPGVRATNEPKRQSCGAPDYILTKKEIPIGFIEAKEPTNKFTLDDPKKMFEIWENDYKALYSYDINDDKDLDYFLLMVKQKYDSVN